MKIKLQRGDYFPLASLVIYNMITAGVVAVMIINPKHEFKVGDQVLAIGGMVAFDAIVIVMSLMALSFTEHIFKPKNRP